jgi:hypothetical protein
MREPGRWRWQKGACLLAAVLFGAPGCLGGLHHIDASHADLVACQTAPKGCRDHVYVFLMNGLDPVNYGNLTGLREYLIKLGYHKTYYGQLYHAGWYTKEVCRIHREDPDAHFVLVGFSLGVNFVDAVAEAANKHGIAIDLMVFLSGNHPVWPMPADRPPNVSRVLNLLCSGSMKAWGERPWAENVRLSNTWHFGSPTHPVTLERLGQELDGLSALVPVHPPVEEPKLPFVEEAPTPRPTKVEPATRRDEWDFLKPASSLGSSSKEATPSPRGQAKTDR